MKKTFPSRISQREIISRRKKRRFFLLSSFIFLIIFSFLYFFFFSNFFAIREINLEGIHFSNKFEVQNTIHSFLNEKFLSIFPQNIFLLTKKKFLFLLEKFPAFIDFQIKKDFLKRKITFFFKERSIEGIYCQKHSQEKECFYFDSFGLLFLEAPQASGFLIFVLEKESPPYLTIGQKIFPFEDFSQFLEIKKISEREEAINFASLKEKEIVFELISGRKIFLNTSDFLQTRIVLENFLEKFSLKDLEYLDLRYLPHLYFKLFSNH